MKKKPSSEQVDLVHDLFKRKVEDYFPEKIVKISNKDKPFITKELKTLDRKRKREWKKKGKSEKYKQLNKEFKEKFLKASSEYLKKNVSELKSSNPGKAARILKTYAANPCETEEDNYVTLTSHIEENLSDEEQLDRISDYFVSIASEFPKLKYEDLSEEVKNKLNSIKQSEIPSVSSQLVYSEMKNIHKEEEKFSAW